jgi:hypothetical protein
MVALGYHLLHGFFSAARTLGIYHPRYANWIRVVGWAYSVAKYGKDSASRFVRSLDVVGFAILPADDREDSATFSSRTQ